MMYRLSTCLLLLLFSAKAAAIHVTLSQEVTVEGPRLELQKIASIQVEPGEDLTEALTLEVADLPSLGRPRLLSNYRVETLLKDRGYSPVIVDGQQCVVHLKSEMASEGHLRKIISHWAQNQVADEVEIEYLNIPSNFQIPAGDGISIDVEARSKNPLGVRTLRLVCKMGPRIMNTARAKVHVHCYKEVLVLKKPLRRKEPLSASHVEWKREDVANGGGMEVSDLVDVEGHLATKDLKAGTHLLLTDFEKPDLIKRGEGAKILVRNGPVSLSINGAEALQSGKLGQTISFKNPVNPKATLRAKVVDRQVALLEISPSRRR